MRGPPVVLTNTLGRPVTNIISERGAVPMTVVNTLGEPVTLVAQGGEPVTLFNENGTLWDYPFSLFSNNEQGAWYDPSDFSTLYQDSTGTTPVTAVEQPVGLMLDRSRGLVLGAELATVSSLTADPIGGPTFTNYAVSGVLTQNRWYKISFTVSNYAGTNTVGIAGSVARFEPDLSNSSIAQDGTVTVIGFWTASGVTMELFNRDTNTCTFTNISIRELPGNHASQSSSASRPILRARYNLLTYSEDFGNAAWTKGNSSATANAAVAPDGTTTADKIVENTAAAEHLVISANTTITSANTVCTSSVYVKAAERTSVHIRAYSGGSPIAQTFFNTLTQTFSSTSGGTWLFENAGNGWYRIQVTATHTNISSNGIGVFCVSGTSLLFYTGDGTSGIYIWGASLLTAADQTATGGAYQRVGAATDYDTSNSVWRPYLAFDGSDDSMSTASVDFSGTDEMTVFAGVHKASDAATALLAELSASVTANNGSFYLAAPGSNGATDIVFIPKGTTAASVTATGIAAPSTSVVTGLSDINAPVSTIRINGAQVAQNTSTQGTGNFGNHPLFIGARNNTSFRFNGRLYGLTVLGRTATAAELGAMEAWVAGKTGVTL